MIAILPKLRRSGILRRCRPSGAGGRSIGLPYKDCAPDGAETISALLCHRVVGENWYAPTRTRGLPPPGRFRRRLSGLVVPLVAMKAAIHWLIPISLLVGCSDQTDKSGPLTVLAGQGIPGVATVDLSLRQIQATVDDLTIEANPAAGLPWQKNSIGGRPRLPWEKPDYFTAVSRSLGMYLCSNREDSPVQQLWFFSDPKTFKVDSSWFTGNLCGPTGRISFADRRRVSRQEVIAVFGEPMLRQAVYDTNAVQLVNEGTSLGIIHSNGNENLFYPTNGISFSLRQGLVTSFLVRKAMPTRVNK